MRITTTVNGTVQEVDDVWPGESLLYVLRERMGLPGSKNAREQGECGSWTRSTGTPGKRGGWDAAPSSRRAEPSCACRAAAGQAMGGEVTTVGGLAEGE